MGLVASRSRPDDPEIQEIVDNNAPGKSSFTHATGQVKNTLRDLGGYLPLYKAAIHGEWRDARTFFDEDPNARTARITIGSETALHIAVGTGGASIKFVEKLVNEMRPEALALKDRYSETALSVAAVVGNILAAKILVNKNPDLPNMYGKNGYPIHQAARFGHREMVLYLLSVTRDIIETNNPFMGEDGGRLLIDVIEADFYDIALDLVNRYPEIATVEVNGLGSPLSVLARKSTAFSSGGVATLAPPMSVLAGKSTAFPGDIPKSRAATLWRHAGHLLFPDTSSSLRRRMETKLIYHQARELVKVLCKEILELDDSRVISLLQPPFLEAAKLGISEIIEEIVEAFPPALWFMDKDNYNVFQLAVLNRHVHVFNLIYQMSDFRYLITTYTDSQGNNMLHLVGRLPPSERLDLVSGPAFLFQREMRWFKEVAKFVRPAQRVAKNKDGYTPEMVFRKQHEQLMKDGVKWTKKTTSSSTVFASLIATVAFGGGLHFTEGRTNGTPIFMHTFVAANFISLFLSFISIMTLLSIIMTRNSEVDFLNDMPQRLYYGLYFLIISITTMLLLAFFVALNQLFGYSEANYQNRLFIYAFPAVLYVVVVLSILIHARTRRFIDDRNMFGRKSERTLH